MAGSTPVFALPYPTDEDTVRALTAQLKSMAEKIDTVLAGYRAVAAGIESALPVAAANTTYSKVVAFPAGRFTLSPAVAVTPDLTDPSQATVSVDAVTATGFTIRYRRTSTAALSVWWLAVTRG